MRSLLPLFLASTVLASAAPTEIGRLTTPPLLDGSSTEWSDIPVHTLANKTGQARARFAHDNQNLYAFVEVRDTSPLLNSASSAQEMLKGGDAVSLFFNSPETGPQRVILGKHEGNTLVYAHRPKSSVKAPYVFTSPVGSAPFDFVGPLADARVVLTPAAFGYTAEIALPWRALGFRRVPERFRFDFQVIFSDPAGSTNVDALWLHASDGPGITVEDLPTEATLYPDTWGEAVLVENAAELQVATTSTTAPASSASSSESINLDLPRVGRLTVVITDDKGWILRELVRAEKRPAGRTTVAWDGRDRYGDPLPAGDYLWKALLFDGVGMNFLGSVGNSARPPYRTEDGLGSLGGQHGSNGVVASDSTGVYLGGGLQEGEPSFRKIDPKTGVSLWKRSPGNFQSVLAVAAAEGRAALITSKGRAPDRTAALVLIDPATGTTLKLAGLNEVDLDLPSDALTPPGFVIAGGRAIYSHPAKKSLGVIDLASGKRLPDLVVEARGLHRLDENTLLACTRDSVVRVDVRTGKTTPVITGLVDPRAVTADPATGHLFVSDLGTSQQIKKFTADGRPLAAFGRLGGKPRTQPVYDPLAFQHITGLAFAADGTLWMKEAHPVPKRFIRLTADGKWLEDFCGPVAYNVVGPDLDDVSTIYYSPSPKDSTVFVEAKVDYAGYASDPARPGNWRITALHDLALGADGTTVNPLMEAVAEIGYGHVIAFKADNGRRFLFRLSKFNRASSPGGAGLWTWEKDRWVPFAFFSADEKSSGLSWRDLNADGLVQDNERYAPAAFDRYSWIDRSLTLHGRDGLLAPASFDASGLPIYLNGTYARHLSEPSRYTNGDHFASAKIGGSTFYAVNSGPHRHLTFWDRATDNRLIKVTDGKIEWITGINDPKDDFAAFSTMSGIAGIVDDLVLVHNVEQSTFITYTTDGMILGNAGALPDGSKPRVGPLAVYIEHFTGLFIKDPTTARRLLFFVVSGDDRIVEITGPGRTERFSGSLRLAKGSAALGDNRPVIPYSTLHSNVSRGL
ncbi:MAG: FlgD immunoglobulin-like domain containing protein, partial [Rariglobus sp.]